MRKIYAIVFVLSCLVSSRSFSQCATNAYISAGSNCISLSWFPSSTIPAELPVSLTYNGDTYTFSSGYGDIGFPAVYKKTAADCLLPSDLVTGNVTSNFSASASFTCQFPGGVLLAIRDISFTVNVEGSKNKLNWSIKDDNTTKSYEVQRSNDGQSFSALKSVASKQISAGVANYSVSDDQPLETSFYRVKVLDKDGSSWFSKVVKLQNEKVKSSLAIFPNPNKGSFTINNISAIAFKSLSIYDAQGRKLSFRATNMNEANKSVNIQITDSKTGVYFVQYNNENQKMHSRFLVQ
ncbi:MAG: T9SS type A sorting domain-containing protein [Bacteroidota bacterium]